jgi:short-subunit dehydrogenase
MVSTKIASMALVTGASSGIGKCFASALAAGGTDLILVARNQKRLEELAARLRTEHGRRVEVMIADLEKRAELAKVEARLRDHDDVDLLVNNAGYGHTGRFADLTLEQSQGQIDCNVSALVRLAHAALQSMRKSRRGGILNVASGAAFLPSPTLAVYAATKAFVVSFTQALREEVKGDNIKVSVICPGFTRTEFQDRAKYDASALPSFVWQTPEAVVAEALSALAAGKVVTSSGLQNKIMGGVVGFIPRSMIAGIVGRMSG